MREPGNNLRQAKNIGRLTRGRTFTNVVSGGDRQDFYRLSLNRRTLLRASLTGLRANADLTLRDGRGRRIAASRQPRNRTEGIARTLSPGTYYLQVSRRQGRTRYRLNLQPSSAQTPRQPQNLFGVYRGFANVRISNVDPLSRQVTGVRSFQTTIVSEVAARRQAGGITETNPFSLFIGSSPSEIAANREGAFTVYSALPFNFRGGFLLQYWRFQYSGNRINGTLINRDSGAALTTNLFNSNRSLGLGLTIPFPYAMDVGTTIQGTLTPAELRVRIQGPDSGRTRLFLADVVARRA